MANPKSKHTRHRTGIRRGANWLVRAEALNNGNCSNCGQPKLPHCVCSNCGFYGGRMILPPKPPKKKEEPQK